MRRIQREERDLLRKLYGTESLANHLRSAATFLRKDQDNEARVLAEELVRLCGQIEGIGRALDTMTRVTRAANASLVVDRGYFTPVFLRRAVDDARRNIDFLIYRNLQFTNVDLLESMEYAAKRGVRIRILALSSRADDSVLEQASMVLPWPQADAKTLRRQLAESEERIRGIVAGWSEPARAKFEYRGYSVAPNVHFVRVDGVLRQGFIGTFSAAQPARLEDRPYLEVSAAGEPGVTLSRHFDQLWERSAARN
ncbi:phospholipase D-like domain-containing protein [Saccharothrix syringae]|uniref:Uncharacterized protein n=1 Tax=Saccharothrix syringae TaxID=103733 RepID=A0A5Q0H258_SACSY|nr:hypothetical protein [Saccharothrix syringae]QFZ19954.1 hypothetical protein EKG83_23275 [Saccharothrix syringae]